MVYHWSAPLVRHGCFPATKPTMAYHWYTSVVMEPRAAKPAPQRGLRSSRGDLRGGLGRPWCTTGALHWYAMGVFRPRNQPWRTTGTPALSWSLGRPNRRLSAGSDHLAVIFAVISVVHGVPLERSTGTPWMFSGHETNHGVPLVHQRCHGASGGQTGASARAPIISR